jgi:nucleotide-binding universal stress UspA family protein
MKTKNILKPEPDHPEASEPGRTAATRSSSPPFRLKRLLVPVDFSTNSLRALEYALGMAEPLDASIIILHVVEPAVHGANYLTVSTAVEETNNNLLMAGRERLEAVSSARSGHGVPIETLVRIGRAHSEIADTAKAMGADWIVLATHGQTDAKHNTLGSTAERVIRTATCPVLAVP